MFWVLGIGDSLSLFRALLIAFWHFCIRSVLNLTSDRRLLPEEEMKLNTHTRGWWGKEKKKKSLPLRSRLHESSANWPVCENEWSHQARAILIHWHGAPRQLEVLHRGSSERGFQKQKISLLTDSITISLRLGLWQLLEAWGLVSWLRQKEGEEDFYPLQVTWNDVSISRCQDCPAK